MTDPLTIGMATRGEFDSVWFTLTGLTANHPRVRYLVVDNSPERCARTEGITRASGGRYVHRPDLSGTSKPRDAVFRLADTPWVMCLDSHVVLESRPVGKLFASAVAELLDWIASDPDSPDLIQGPMVMDDGRGYATHWTQPRPPGLWGEWGTDARADPAGGGEPFEIPMMGLGLWAMRRDRWPGFNPLFTGFGGEEGYLHELVRQRGGRCRCLPALRWRHKFRDPAAPPPYPLRLEDHVWNLLVGHRELGIEAGEAIHDHFGKRLPPALWRGLVERSAGLQPFGGPRPGGDRKRILGVWYSDNTAPGQLLRRSLGTVSEAVRQTLRHDVTAVACSWEPVPVPPEEVAHVTRVRFGGAHVRAHATILAQMEEAAAEATRQGEEYDAVCFLEHDVLYPPDYFDRVGDAWAARPDSTVVSHQDYIGLNATGWLGVRDRHEPMHQLSARWDVFRANQERARADCATQGWALVEPDSGGDRSRWARVGAGGNNMPAVHVNHTAGRFTSHGEVVYNPHSEGVSRHPFWGEARDWWPGGTEAAPSPPAKAAPAARPGACGCAADAPQTLEQWADEAARAPSDFHEHVGAVRELAGRCEHVTELSSWYKCFDAAAAAGLPPAGRFVSVCAGGKPSWAALARFLGDRFTGFRADPADRLQLPETDLLFADTGHTAAKLLRLLEHYHPRVRKYIAVHCTVTFGVTGDEPEQPGVLQGLRAFCRAHPEWAVIRKDEHNHGLVVLSRLAEDRKDLPGTWRKAMNYAAAALRWRAAGRPTVSQRILDERHGECAVCPERALDACAACGCPLEEKLPLATETCGYAKQGKPVRWGPVTDPAGLEGET